VLGGWDLIFVLTSIKCGSFGFYWQKCSGRYVVRDLFVGINLVGVWCVNGFGCTYCELAFTTGFCGVAVAL